MDQSRKLPIFQSIQNAARGRADASSHAIGKSIPATVSAVDGAIVTVNFELDSGFVLPKINVPILGSEYIRIPVQVGCKGIVIACDYYIGAMSGLGTGRATALKRGNLSNLVFMPIGNSDWTDYDGDTLTLYGVSSVEIMDKPGGSSLVRVEENAITLENGDSSVEVSSSGVSIIGTLTINGQEYTSHTHTNGNEGQPTGGVIT